MLTALITADNLADLIINADATLATLTSHYIRGVSLLITDPVRTSANELAVFLSYDTGAPAITTPYQLALYDGRTMAEARGSLAAAQAAGPGYFWSAALPISLDDTRRVRRHFAGAFYNTSFAAGTQNWVPVGSAPPPTPSGSGTAGVGTTTLDSVAMADYRVVEYDFAFKKGTQTYGGRIVAGNDGVTSVSSAEYGAVLVGAAPDVVLTVIASGADMVLQATTASGGWTYEFSRISALG